MVLVLALQIGSENSGLLTLLGFVGLVFVVLLIVVVLYIFFMGQRHQQQIRTRDAEIERLAIANKRGELLVEMSHVLSTTLDYRKVLQTMIDISLPALSDGDQQTSVGLALLFESNNELKVAAGRNIAASDKQQWISRQERLIDQTINAADAVVSHNVKKDVALVKSLSKCRSAVCAPLRVGIDTYGVVIFGTSTADFYTEEHAHLLKTLCSQVVIPLENAQLIEDLRREQQKILAKEEEARRKLARDLHDGPTQSIASITMRLNFIKMILQNGDINKAQEEIVKVEDIAQKTTAEIRTMLFAMRPVILETKGLIAALDGYADRLNVNESFEVVVNNDGYDGHLESDKEGVIFAIVEEAVGNAKKHARATEIKITVKVEKNNLLVEIRDNGVGFDVEKTRSTYDQRSSLGMINLYERSEAIGGQCRIDSATGQGTAVRVTVPVSR